MMPDREIEPGQRLRQLLFLSPSMPAPAGNGLAMRAAMMLGALATRFRVRVLVVPVVGDPHERPSRMVRELADEIAVLDLRGRLDPHFALIERLRDDEERTAALVAYPRPLLCRFSSSETQRAVQSRFTFQALAAVHVMRLYLAPYASAFLTPTGPGRPALVLDQDDDEPLTHERIAQIHERKGNAAGARRARAEAGKFRDLERAVLQRFDRVLVCSDRDRAALAGRVAPERIAVVPNAVQAAHGQDMGRRLGIASGGSTAFLFVGTLGYVPNADAAHYFCESILPLIRARVPDAKVALVGRGAGRDVRRLSKLPGVRFVGAVRDLGGYYARAQVVVVPLRAGGGTRIKILEAFAHRRPVVSTAVGAEGLDVEPGRHLLVADTAQGFAEACVQLLEDRALAERLADQAAALRAERYSHEAAARALSRAYEGLCKPALSQAELQRLEEPAPSGE